MVDNIDQISQAWGLYLENMQSQTMKHFVGRQKKRMFMKMKNSQKWIFRDKNQDVFL